MPPQVLFRNSGMFGVLAACSVLLSPFTAMAQDTEVSTVIDSDEGKFFLTTPENDLGMYVDITPANKDNKTIGTRLPSDCPECGNDCLMPPLFWWESQELETELGGGSVTVTADNPSRCVRFDGSRLTRDSLIYLVIANDRKDKFLVRVLESGKLLHEGDILPGESLTEEVIPAGDRRYTFSISADPNQAIVLPTNVGFSVYRYEGGKDPAKSLVQFYFGSGQ